MPIINSLGTLTYPKIYYYSLPSGAWINLAVDQTNTLETFVSGIDRVSTNINVDSNYNTYITSFDPSTTSSTYVSKFNTSGVNSFYENFLNTDGVKLLAVETDSAGNIYLAGVNTRRVISNVYPTIFVTKVDSAGTVQWQNQYYTTLNNDTGLGIRLDASNNVYVIATGLTSIGNRRIGEFLKINGGTGSLTWSNFIISTVTVNIWDSIVDGSGNSYLVVSKNTSPGAPTYYIQKYNSSGVQQWEKTINTTIRSICLVDINIAVSTLDGIIVLNTSGTILNQTSAGMNLTDSRICSDSSANLYVMGTTAGSPYYVKLCKFDSSYNTSWVNRISVAGATSAATVSGIAINGITESYITFAYGQYDNPNNLMWAYNLPTNGEILKTGTYSLGGYTITYENTTLVNTPTSYTSTTSTDLPASSGSFTTQALSLTNILGSGLWSNLPL